MTLKEVNKYIIIITLFLLAYLAFLIIKPFIIALLTSAVLAYLFYPLHKKFTKLIKYETVSATIITILILIIILLPTAYIINSLAKESITIYKSGIVENTIEQGSEYLHTKESISNFSTDIASSLVKYGKEKATDFLTSIPLKIFDFLIAIYGIFIFLLLGNKIIKKLKKFLPIKRKDELIAHLGDTTYSIVYGLFVTAIIEFVLAIIVFKLIGSPAAILLALIIGFLAFIPVLGPGMVWIPYLILELLKKDYFHAIILISLGIILFIIETFVRPKITGDHAKVEPAIILIGTFGGIAFMGFIGMVIGPLILSAIFIIAEEYSPEVEE